jgi:hypothetical protein
MTEENAVTERDIRAATKSVSWAAQREAFLLLQGDASGTPR